MPRAVPVWPLELLQRPQERQLLRGQQRYSVLLHNLTVTQLVKKFPVFLWHSKLQHHGHRTPPLDSNLSQLKPVHSLATYFLDMHLTSTKSCEVVTFLRVLHWTGDWVGIGASPDAVAKRWNTRPWREWNPGRPYRSLVTTLTELPRLFIIKVYKIFY
jgi:hypothetical protein